jgi:Beta-glucosidase-related glycosidases
MKIRIWGKHTTILSTFVLLAATVLLAYPGGMSKSNAAERLAALTPQSEQIRAEAERRLADMTLEQKLYQMFVVTADQLSGAPAFTVADDGMRGKLGERPVGGVIFFAQNLVSGQQTSEMLKNLQQYGKEASGVPLFLCVDEEGGRVSKIGRNSQFGVKKIDPMADIADAGQAYEAGAVIGGYLRELGFNVNFAPDADVLTNPDNQAIGDRSFGTDAGRVTECAVAYSNGLHSQNILSTFKHYPGHGGTVGDTHDGCAHTDKTYEELMGNELMPFRAAGENGVDLIMAAHISAPAVVGDNTPCSLSHRMIAEILRGDLGYEGLVVTDALNMGAVAENYSAAEAAVLAVKAGADLILMPADLDAAFMGLHQAVRSGEIPESRIDESVRRILCAKLCME